MQLAQTPSTLNAASEKSSKEILMLEVGGMKCAGCVKAVERQLTQQSGVISATVNLVTEIAIVEYRLGEVNPGVLAEQLAKQLTLTGFPAQPRQSSKLGSPDTENSWTERHRQETGQQIWRIITCGILILLSGMSHLHHLNWGHLPLVNTIGFHWGLATLAFLVPGRAIVVDGFRSWRRNAPNMNTLVSLGTLTAYGTSCVALLLPQLGWECFFDEPVMMLGFILLGKTLEQQARFRAARALRSLLALQPATAHLVTHPIPSPLDNGASLLSLQSLQSIEIPADQVRVGEWLQILPGEKIPVDGDVRQGKTTVDESMLTGEALPVLKQGGDFVSAGTLNHSGVILMEATRTGEETTLAQIIQLVETAQTRKAPIQTLADAVAGYFTYGVISLAAFTFLFWYCVGVNLWPQVLTLTNVETTFAPLMLSLKLAIAVLVIACPCAMGLATPTAILVGSGIGAEQGLLIKGGDILERVHRLNIVVFDKTGTLTTGQPQITDCITNEALTPNLTPDSLLQLAATVEQGSCHPIAQALCAAANQQGLLKQAAEDFYTEPGLGVSATVEGQTVLVGNAAWLNHHHVDLESNLPDLPGKTLVHLAIADQWVGTLGMQDALRPEAKSTIEQLQKMGLRVMLLTGDRREVAESIAQALNLDPADVLADVRPEDKVKTITNLQAQGQQVAMVGDGINDAPALTQADVGIGLRTGTEVSMEAADIVLMQDDLMAVVRSIRLSQATFNKIRQNLCWAFGYNLLSIPVAAGMLLPSLGVVLSPASAGALMAFSSVSVVTNSLLLRRQFQD
ncbi:MAG: heavy metal translocating P-type ATPase [Microcoleaceae cyanobacterium]